MSKMDAFVCTHSVTHLLSTFQDKKVLFKKNVAYMRFCCVSTEQAQLILRVNFFMNECVAVDQMNKTLP